VTTSESPLLYVCVVFLFEPSLDLVQVDWLEDEDDTKNIASNKGHPSLEGTTTYQVGFMRVPVYFSILPAGRVCSITAWKVFGVARPPEISDDY
jgi:hypothetical protein